MLNGFLNVYSFRFVDFGDCNMVFGSDREPTLQENDRHFSDLRHILWWYMPDVTMSV